MFRVVADASSTRAFSRIGFDLGAGVVYLGAQLALRGVEEKRPYELLLVLCLSLRPLDLTRVRRELFGAPILRKVRESARLLVERRVAVWAARDVLALPVGATVSHAPVELGRALERLRAMLAVDGRLSASSGKADALRARLADLEGLLLRQDHTAVMRIVQSSAGEESFLTALARGISERERPKMLLLAHTVAGMAAMNIADLATAEHHLVRAGEIARVVSGATYWQTRILATRASVARMRAALDGDRAAEHLLAALEHWRQMDTLREQAQDLPEDLQGALIAWRAELATPITLLADVGASREADLRVARESIDSARVMSEGPIADPSVGPTADLMDLRVAISEGRDRAALDGFEAFERRASAPGTPPWLKGWGPRYAADLAFREHADTDTLWRHLAAAWRANTTLRFQRLLILARVAAWAVPSAFLPPDPRVDVVDEMLGLTDEVHAERRGHPCEACSRCQTRGSPRVALGRRVRCALGIVESGPLRLGAWR